MKPRLRKLALSVHLTCSVGWIGAAIVYLVMGILAVNSEEARTIRAAWVAMELAGWYVIVPLAVASLLTGVVMALGTKWGLFRYYWVAISFALTLACVVVLVLHMPDVSEMAALALRSEGDALEALGGDLVHPSLGLVVLIVIQVLNLYKPPGMTRHGLRKQQQDAAEVPTGG